MADRVLELIGADLQAFSVSAFAGLEQDLPIYLHLWQSSEDVYGGFTETQTIQAKSIPPDLLQWMLQSLARLDDIIGLDFYFQDSSSGSKIDLYLDSEIELGDGSNILGLATPNQLNTGTRRRPVYESWWEIFLNAPELASDQLRYAVLHELGHALGLEHPFDDNDQDVWGVQGGDPDGLATVMSYTIPQDRVWPDFYSPLDLAALATIWGLEGDHSQWRFTSPQGVEQLLSSQDALARLSEQRVGERLIGPVMADASLPERLDFDANDLVPLQPKSLVPQSPKGTIFVAFTEELLRDSLLVEAFNQALALLDASLSLDFQLLDDSESPLVTLLLDRQVLPVEALQAPVMAMGAVESLVSEVDVNGDTVLLSLKQRVSVDPLNPYYAFVDDFVDYRSYLNYAALQQLSFALGLQEPWADTPSEWESFDASQTILARRFDQPIAEATLSSADLNALISLYGAELEPQSVPVDDALPSLQLGSISSKPEYWSGTTAFEVPVVRTGNPDLDVAVVVDFSFSAIDPSQDLSAWSGSQLLRLPAGVNVVSLDFTVPTGSVDFAELQLNQLVNVSAVDPLLGVDVHGFEVALGVDHLIDQRVLAAERSPLLQDQGSGHLFYSLAADLDALWLTALDQLLSELDSVLDLSLQRVDVDHPLAQLRFTALGPGDPLASVHHVPQLALAGQVFTQQSTLELRLPQPASAELAFALQQADVLQECLLALGLERPQDRSDRDGYTYTPVLPRDSALFSHAGAQFQQPLITDLDRQALAQLGWAGGPAAEPLLVSDLSGFALELIPAASGVLDGKTQCSILVRRLGDASLDARLALQLTSADAFSQAVAVHFAPGDQEVIATIEWPQHQVSEAEVSLHVLSGALPVASAWTFDSDQLGPLNEHSLPTDDSQPPASFVLMADAIHEYQPAGALVGSLGYADSAQLGPVVYSLVAGPGSEDNSLFALSADSLYLNDVPDYEQRHDYQLRLRQTDANGGFVEQAFVLPVEDFVERSLPLVFPLGGVVPFSPAVSGELSVYVPPAPELIGFDALDLELVVDPAVGLVSGAVVASDLSQWLSVPWSSASALNGATLVVDFQPVDQRFDAVTGQPLSGLVEYWGHSIQDSAVLFQGSTSLTAFNLDVDGDGSVRPFSDGLMLIRKLLGSAFAGEALTDKALPQGSTRSTAEIHAFIEAGISSGDLDLDGDGRVTAFGDGLMLIRSLLGFRGDALIDKALSASSPWSQEPEAADAIQQSIQALVAPAHRADW